MATLDAALNSSQTLAQRISDGPLPGPEAVRYALMLAEALQRVHDAGRAVGVFTPSDIAIGGGGLQLNDAPRPAIPITPYTAPEMLQGGPSTACSDIFSFGAIVYEAASGRRAFAGDSPEALARSLASAPAPGCGIPALDRLLGNCLAQDPAARYQRMQRVILELKLVAVLAQRAAETQTRRQGLADLGGDLRLVETRLAAGLQAQERSLNDLEGATREALDALRSSVMETGSQAAAALERAGDVERGVERFGAQLTQMDQKSGALDQRALSLEQTLEAVRQGTILLEGEINAQAQQFAQALRSQEAAIASVRAAQAQSDDLIESVVGALELLQEAMLDRE